MWHAGAIGASSVELGAFLPAFFSAEKTDRWRTLGPCAARSSAADRPSQSVSIARRDVMGSSVEDFNCIVRDQFLVLQFVPERALETMAVMVPKAAQRRELLKQLRVIVGADDLASAAEGERLARLTQLFGVQVDALTASAIAL